jgi:hypothetical protein
MTPVGGAAAPSSVIFGYFPVMNEQLVLDVHYDGRANGTVVDLATKNGTPAQAWSWSGVTDLFPFQGYEYFPGEIYLNDTSQGAKCLTAAGDYSGAPVYIYDCGAAPYQSWAHVYPDQWVLAGTEMCLDVPNGSLASGEPLWVWSCWGGLNQQWNSPRTGSF